MVAVMEGKATIMTVTTGTAMGMVRIERDRQLIRVQKGVGTARSRI